MEVDLTYQIYEIKGVRISMLQEVLNLLDNINKL